MNTPLYFHSQNEASFVTFYLLPSGRKTFQQGVYSYRKESAPIGAWPRGYKTFFMLNSTEHENFPARKC